MAHAARVSALADNLVASLLAIDKDDPVISQTRGAVAKGLRDSSHGRTNQFEVAARLDGLVEKFAVLNRDDLSDALQERLEELPTKGKWLPEILALFLSLSDRPVEKTATDALATLRAAEHPEEQFTWEDIIADDPLDEPGIWDDIERGYHSSGDETGFGQDDDSGSEPTTSTKASTINEHDPAVLAGLLVTQPEGEALELVKHSRSAAKLSDGDQVLHVSELAVVRDSLFMLRGLPTVLFEMNTLTGAIKPKPDTTTMTASRRVISDALMQFSALGNSLQHVRQWVQGVQSLPYVRTCQAITERQLADFGIQLATLEERYVGKSVDTVVSMIQVLCETQNLARHLASIASIIAHMPSDSPFALLDELFDYVCTAQLTGDHEAFSALGAILFEGVQTYIRPVATWISNGIIAVDLQDFFVEQSAVACEPGDLWHLKYTLRRSSDGSPHTPRFLQNIAKDIFAKGKAKMFLDHLVHGSNVPEVKTYTQPGPDFASLRLEVEINPLTSFSELFDTTLQAWTQNISTDVAPRLKGLLLNQHGLLGLLSATDSIYTSANGALFQDFTDSLFERIVRSPSGWSNNFLLTELARETLGDARDVNPESLSITTEDIPRSANITQALQTINTTYHIPWALQNITREATPQTHARAFNFLLQISHAYHSLQTQTFQLCDMHATSLTPTLSTALHIRQTLLVLTATFRAHITTSAHISRTQVHAAMLSAPDIDGTVAAYAAYKQRLETALFLSPNLRPIREAVLSALAICETFVPVWEVVTSTSTGNSSGAHIHERILRKMRKDLASSLSFITTGVRSIGRASGEVLLEVLAEKLEWMAVKQSYQ
jgi:gamma-tubulin complex component 5